MKKVGKSGISLFMVIAMMFAGVLSACSGKSDTDTDINEVEYVDSTQTSTAAKKPANLRTIKTAIIQYDSSEILEETCTAIQAVFDDNNIEYNIFVGDDDNPEDTCIEYANNTVINGGYDAIMAIGAKAADDVYSTVRTASKIPVVFCAPDEPILNSFAQRIKDGSDKCYGITIKNNLAYAQFDMINTFQPTITYLGVVYLAGDERSQAYLGSLEKSCKDNGVVLNKQKAADMAEFMYMIENVAYQVEAITLLPENSLENEMDRISQKAISENIPLYGIEDIDNAEKFPASVCYDYKQMGEDSANLMINLMHGEDMSDTNVITVVPCKVYGNTPLLKKFDIEIPDDYKDRFVEAGGR